MKPDFHVECVPGGAHTEVLRVRGQLDARTAPLLLRHAALVRSAGQNLVLNLEGVSLIASSGIGALLALVEEFQQAACRVRIAAASPAVDGVIRLLNLDQFLALDPSESVSLTALEP